MRAARAGGQCPAPSRRSGSSGDVRVPRTVVTIAAARPAPRRCRYPSAASVLGSAHWRSSMSSTIGPCSATSATSASSDLDLVELRPGRVEGELGQELGERGHATRVEVDVRERVAQRSRERHVGQMPLELRTARASDADAVELAHQLVEQAASSRVRPHPRSGSAPGPRRAPRRTAPCERLELGGPAEQAECASGGLCSWPAGSGEGAASGRPPGG